MKLLVVALLLAALPLHGHAQSLDQLRQVEQLNGALDLVKDLQSQLDVMARTRKTDCLKAFGNDTFCGCINAKLAVAWTFADYVAITIRSKEENGYESLSNDLKTAYDNVTSIRDTCVVASASGT